MIDDNVAVEMDEARPSSEGMENLRPLPRISIHAFCETENISEVIDACSKDRRMSKVQLRLTNGPISTAASVYSSSPTPNLLILETRSTPAEMLSELEPLAQVCDPSTRVLIIGHYNDVGLYRDLLKNGISEYIVAPISMVDVLSLLSNIFVDPEAEPIGSSIAFIGAKGGVGSSTIAHNCAWEISTLFDTEVILADMDMAFGTANINFDQDPPLGMSEAVFSSDRLDEVFLDRLLVKCADHLSMLASPSVLERTYDLGEGAFAPLLELVQQVAPTAVYDVPHMWTDWTKKVLSEVDEVVITAIPDLVNLRNTKNLIDTLSKLRPNDKPPKLILNQVGMPKRPEISPNDFCDPLGVEPSAIIPFDAQLFGNAVNSARMIAETDGRSPIVESLSQLAHLLTGRSTGKKAKSRGLASLRALLQK